MSLTRSLGRSHNELRSISINTIDHLHAEGAVMVHYGHTQVMCLASVVEGVPRFLHDANQGWVTAEYSMLPRATNSRNERESSKGKASPRSIEIQRLIARCMRSMVDLSLLKGYTIVVDCDVLQADGSTRTAAITGAAVALAQAIQHMQYKRLIKEDPLKYMVSGVSVGWSDKHGALLDLDYQEDHKIDTDMNVVMTSEGRLVEVQSTAEGEALAVEHFQAMLDLAQAGCQKLTEMQKSCL